MKRTYVPSQQIHPRRSDEHDASRGRARACRLARPRLSPVVFSRDSLNDLSSPPKALFSLSAVATNASGLLSTLK
ncbi:hypothetical protein CYMTET_17831 [Cymbomonas tetramitiformis]|uniref:Uncharacterized protein n=1 Tax=Cymbomonas tetramitiformis TaxID=36881 RepID=A0AAE0L6J2_9CHLO|nr:hypothetical protein CYMTET_17831 [Cymbomonas tetramitiformis]